MTLKEKTKQEVIDLQKQFYSDGLAGCKFAQYATQNSYPSGWNFEVLEDIKIESIDDVIKKHINDVSTNQLSLIFPTTKNLEDLKILLSILKESSILFFEQESEYNNYICIRLRAKIKEKISWVSGFGPFDFLPKTRRSPFTELVFRVKDKPSYIKCIQPETPYDQLHVANLEVPYMTREEFTNAWTGSFKKTKEILGHKPDELTAAKTTFSIPK